MDEDDNFKKFPSITAGVEEEYEYHGGHSHGEPAKKS